MKVEIIHHDNEIGIEIEELESMLAPQSSATFLD